MSAIPTGLILEAVNRGEATLPALKQATGFDYPKLLAALEGDLSMAVRREETSDGFLRFYPLGGKLEPQVVRIPIGPLCVACRVECRKTHQSGAGFVGGEARWYCPKCKARFSGTHAKGDNMALISELDEHAAAKDKLNEIIANGQPCPSCGGKKSAGTEMCRKCFTTPEKNGRHAKKLGRPVAPIDLHELEDALANPALTIADIGAQFGVNRNTIYDRKDSDSEFKAAYERGMQRREAAVAQELEAVQIEAGLAEVEVLAPPVEETEEVVSPVGDTALERPFIPALTPPAPTLEEARIAQIDGVAYGLEAVGEFPPSAVLKKIVWDDDFFMVSYETLLAILDEDMAQAEKDAVWLLLRYLKRVEKADLMNKFMGSWIKVPEDKREGLAKALRAVNGG